jgi:hypothetical protein
MKLFNRILVSYSLIFLIFISCKKMQNNRISKQELPFAAENEMIQEIQTWFKNQPGDITNLNIMLGTGLVKTEKLIAWSETQYFPDNRISITPVRLKNAENAPLYKYLALIFSERGKVSEGYYFDVVEKNAGENINWKYDNP